MRSEDEIIQQDVIDQLGGEDTLESATIGISVKQGVVHLSGTVATEADRRDAERAAYRAADVRSVVNDLQIQSPAILQ